VNQATPSRTADDFATLDGRQYMSLTTFRKDGQPVPTPVWFARAGDKLYVFSDASAGKIKRIRNTSRVTVAPCTLRGDVLGPPLEATARILGSPAERKLADDALLRKYGLTMRALRLLDRIRGGRDADLAFIEISPV
jgi:PPOX class probable F420-dependent enzyme